MDAMVSNAPDATKRCAGCKQLLSFDLFESHSRSKDGKNPSCKLCVRQRRAESLAKRRASKADKEIQSHKTCSACTLVLPRSDFYASKGHTDGLRVECKRCYSNKSKARLKLKVEAQIQKSTTTKKCKGCNVSYHLHKFHLSRTAADGRTAKCPSCRAADKKMVAAKRAPALPETQKRCIGCSKWLPLDLYQNEGDGKYGKRASCKSCRSMQLKVKLKEKAALVRASFGTGKRLNLASAIKSMVRSANRRGLKVSTEHLHELIGSPCHYCNRKESPNLPMTIDRIDSDEDYIPSNTVSACWPCNYAKGNSHVQRFLYVINKISLHCSDYIVTDQDRSDLDDFGSCIRVGATRTVPKHVQDAQAIMLNADQVIDLWTGPCFYCGGQSFGIDRVVPGARGGLYDTGNSKSCCWDCNKAKGGMTYGSFIALVRLISTYTISQGKEVSDVDVASLAAMTAKGPRKPVRIKTRKGSLILQSSHLFVGSIHVGMKLSMMDLLAPPSVKDFNEQQVSSHDMVEILCSHLAGGESWIEQRLQKLLARQRQRATDISGLQ